ncbi:mannose-P-dolichol utilization defect 1 protein-like [Liolophura sinensis]|uniref:mannose-P-dolichol utilization defect 1 protein-like n=1 Tax=Liolophura sinensis TaxID=3198878 RepID=UPI0031596FC3
MENTATSIIPSVLEPWVQIVVPQPCYDRFFIDLDFLNVLCLKVVLSKSLGFAIILGSVLVKLPQILKIISAKSAEGISFVGVILELAAISSTAAYGFAHSFPFSAYGEALFLVIQTVLIGFLVLFFGGQAFQAFLFLAVYGGIMAYLMSPMAPLTLLAYLQASNIIIVLASKLIQASTNYRNSSTGQLSAITVGLLFLGSVARIFTSAQETGDQLIVLTYIVATACNGLIVSQMAYYWKSPPQTEETVNRGDNCTVDKMIPLYTE